MKVLVTLIGIMAISYSAYAGNMSVSAPVSVVQQTLEITLSNGLCPMNSEQLGGRDHYYSFCSVGGFTLHLPAGGKIVEGLDSELFRVVVDSGTIYIETKDHQTDFATIKALVLTGQAKVKVIYQGPQIK
jgi:hypothetical protein